MKKFISILITIMMLMQMFTFSVSSEEASMYVRWTGEGPGEIEFTTISSVTDYEIRLYKNEKLVVETSHSVGDYDVTLVKTWFLDEITQNGTGTYRAEVSYVDGMCVTTDDYYYKAPTDTLAKAENLVFNQEKNYVMWDAVEGAKLYDLVFSFSTDGGQNFWPICSYILDAEEDGTFFDFWENPEDELKWIEESYQQEMINCGATAEEFIRAIQVVAYPADLNDANPSYSDYVTFDGTTIPDDGGDLPVYTVEFENVKLEYEYGEDFYIEVYRYDENGEKITVGNDEWWVEGYDPYTSGWQEVTVFCENRVETYNVYVYEETEPEYEIRFDNAQIEYAYGEEFYVEVYMVTADGIETRVYDYEIQDFDPYTPGWQVVTVTYGNYSQVFKALVNEKEGEVGELEYIKVGYFVEEYYPGDGFYAEVYVYTADGNAYQVEDYEIEGFDSYTPGEQIVTIWYGDLSTTVTVWVYEKIAPGDDVVGDGATWSYNPQSGAFGYFGEGDMPDYGTYNGLNSPAPWSDYCKEIKSITIGNKVTSISYGAFAYCPLLENIDFGNSLIKIEGYAFERSPLIQSVLLPDSLTTLGNGVFRDCTGIKEVVLGSNFRNMIDAFSGCKNLTSITLPEGLTEVGIMSFLNCTGLTEVYMPSTVTEVKNSAFGFCTSLTDVHYNGTISQWEQVSVLSGNECLTEANIHCTDGDVVKEEPDPSYSVTFENVKTGYNIGEEFYIEVYEYTAEGERITVTDYEVTGFDSTIAGEQTVTVSYGDYCETFVVYVNDIVEPTWWEYDAANLELIIKGEMGSYGYELNAGTTEAPWAHLAQEVERISIWDGVTSITDGVFINFTNLKEINLGGTVNKIGICAFERCTALEYITIPDSVRYIAPRAFANSGLRTIDFGYGLTKIDSSAFQNCKFESISFPESLRTIGINAFIGCRNLMKVYIPNSVKEISARAFNHCTLLTDIYYGGTAEEWNSINIDTDNEQLSNAAIHFADEEPIEPQPEVKIEYVKTTYEFGENFYAEVYVLSEDGNYYQTNDYWTTGFCSTVSGYQTVIIHYGDYTSEEFEVKVYPRPSVGGGGSGGGGGSVTTAPVIIVSEEKCKTGNTVEVVVAIERNTGFTNLGLEISYDQTLKLVDVIPNSAISAIYTPAQNFDVYPYNFDFTATSNVTYDGELVRLVFEVPEDTQPGDYFVNVDYYKGRDGNYIDGVNVNLDENENSLGLCYENGFVNVYNYIPGDINGDGTVDNKDGTALLRHLAGWTLEQIDLNAVDTNGDGTVDNKDGTRLLRYLAGWDVEVY